MSSATLLVDPLAALFRPALSGAPPLELESTYLEVTLLGPLAKVAVVRHFTNAGNRPIEAVLTLPPLAPHETVYRFIVNVGGIECEAAPVSRRHARTAHDEAVDGGRVAILHEVLGNGLQLLSVAGVAPGARVEVQIWSIRPLRRLAADRARLTIPMGARQAAATITLADVDALVTTSARHPATLSVSADALKVTLTGQARPDQVLNSDARHGMAEPVDVDCASPVILEIEALASGALDHRQWQVDQVGGWEVTASRGAETFHHPANPAGEVTSERRDWIFGVVETDEDVIRVTAPLGGEEIAPNARALRAFAVAGLVEMATPQDPAAVRQTANILSRRSSLAFIGPTGDVSREPPVLRKLALADMDMIATEDEPPPPVALEPFDYGPPPEPEAPQLPIKDGPHTTPGAKPPRLRFLWRGLTPGFGVAASVALFQLIDYPLPPRLIAILVALAAAAAWLAPPPGAAVWRRLPLLAILPLPWILALIAGPIVSNHTYGGAPPPKGMVEVQWWMLAATAVLGLALPLFVRKAWAFTLTVGLLNLVLAAFVTFSGVLLLNPD